MEGTVAGTIVPVQPSEKVRKINLPVASALAVILFLYSVDVFVVIVPWLTVATVPGATNTLILTCTTGLALYCYMFCVLVDPGRVPDGWQPDSEADLAVREVKRKGGHQRFCQKCQRPKPPRTHHCRVCQRCVLRMDHHCPWTNNCIGHANYKAFLLFLTYANAALLHTLVLIASHLVHMLQTSQQQLVIRTGPHGKPVQLQDSGLKSIWVWALLQALAFVIALPLTVGLLLLLGWHIHLTLTNKTTIEYQEGVTARMGCGDVYEHPYDIGPCGNLHEILGDNGVDWLGPPCSSSSGGTRFPTAHEARMLGLS